MVNNETSKVLNDLLEYLYDSHDGYRDCAKEISDKRFKDVFNQLITVRQTMITALQAEVSRLGEKAETMGSTLAAGHRLFIDLKSFLTDGDTDSIIKEVNRGENLLIEKYKLALTKNLSPQIKQLMRSQLHEIESNLSFINTLSENTEKTT